MNILGISAFYHDSAAALVSGGKIVSAAQEERFTRKKFDESFPEHSIKSCLAIANCRLSDLDAVVFFLKPFLKFERLLEAHIGAAPHGVKLFSIAMPFWVKDKLFQKFSLVRALQRIDSRFDESKLRFSEHHFSHAASAFYPSPFEEAVVLTLDGVGEWTTSSVCLGKGSELQILKEQFYPHSLGLLYAAFTAYLGFKVNSGEYKVMGLAPYGRPIFANRILQHLLDLKEDGSFRLNLKYFDFWRGLRMVNHAFEKLFEQPARKPESKLEQVHMDLAASVQVMTEEILLRLTRNLAQEFRVDSLCLAGGVALNCVANSKVLQDGRFKNIWVQPAAGDAGGALGAALAAYYNRPGVKRQLSTRDSMQGAFLGTDYSQEEIERQLSNCQAKYRLVSEDELPKITAQMLSQGFAIGWFQGRMEFGPRALGARSILADARPPETQRVLNLKIKFRESFRPFAPIVLQERAREWFDLEIDSPYMSFVAQVKEGKRSIIPAVTHVDGSARVQTVEQLIHPKLHSVLKHFEGLTQCPVLVNTSFNVRGEPIVESPEDAWRCFMGTDLEALVIGRCVLLKTEQPSLLRADHKSRFALD